MFFEDEENKVEAEVAEDEEEVSEEDEKELEALEDGIVAGLEDVDTVPLFNNPSLITQ